MGYVSYDSLIAEPVRCDMTVFPSLYEAQSIAMLDALACSKPVVAFALPFAQEIIRDGETGLLADAMDSRSPANCISALLQEKQLRRELSRNAQEYVRLHHTWSTITDRDVTIYHQATKNG